MSRVTQQSTTKQFLTTGSQGQREPRAGLEVEGCAQGCKDSSTTQQSTNKSFLTARTQGGGGPREQRAESGAPCKTLHLEPMARSQGLHLELQAKC
mmetsp:Transcript_16892/g.35464  ORF Transcript_16892/g.35464 Transcript_16892/m.35464 type:complete len:96 (+) Transcript_16892:423-710(+)